MENIEEFSSTVNKKNRTRRKVIIVSAAIVIIIFVFELFLYISDYKQDWYSEDGKVSVHLPKGWHVVDLKPDKTSLMKGQSMGRASLLIGRVPMNTNFDGFVKMWRDCLSTDDRISTFSEEQDCSVSGHQAKKFSYVITNNGEVYKKYLYILRAVDYDYAIDFCFYEDDVQKYLDDIDTILSNIYIE